jgi:hypothetical protein
MNGKTAMEGRGHRTAGPLKSFQTGARRACEQKISS